MNPLDSALLLGDGKVTLGQLLSPAWRFKDLGEVFLSCCETGVGLPQSLSDDLLTLGTGFLCAGARTVISSLWSIYVISTVIFCGYYHQSPYQATDRALAIQQTQWRIRNLSGGELKAFWEQEFKPLLIAQDEKLRASGQYEAANALQEAEEQMERFFPEECPFAHPIYWAAFKCEGLR